MSKMYVPKRGEVYWYVDSWDTIRCTENDGYTVDENRITSGNCFLTEEDASRALYEIKAIFKSRVLESVHDSDTIDPSDVPGRHLPDWCKVGAICWHKRCGYFKVTYIDDVSKRVDIQQMEDNSKGYLSFHTVCDFDEVRPARLRPYNAEEMRGLVGKTIEASSSIELVICFDKYTGEVITHDETYSAELLIQYNCTINGKNCGVLEHPENGEWVQ